MSVFMICEQALGLIRGKRLVMSAAERRMLEALDYEGLINAKAQDEAVSCARHFASVRDRLLYEHPWVCARARVALAQFDYDGTDEFPYWYAVPVDCIRPLAVTRQSVHGRMRAEKWIRIGNRIGVKYERAVLWYTKRLADTDQWDVMFRDAFCWSLAAEMSAGVTGEAGAFQQAEQAAMMRVSEARDSGAIRYPEAIPEERGSFGLFWDRHARRYEDARSAL